MCRECSRCMLLVMEILLAENLLVMMVLVMWYRRELLVSSNKKLPQSINLKKTCFNERYSRDNCILMASSNKNEAKFKAVTIQSQQNKGWGASIWDNKLRGSFKKKNCIFYDIWQKGIGSKDQNQISEKNLNLDKVSGGVGKRLQCHKNSYLKNLVI